MAKRGLGELPFPERRFDELGYSSGRITGRTIPIFVGTTAIKVMPQNDKRAYLFFQNRGTDSIFISLGDTVDITSPHINAIELLPGAVYEPNIGSQFIIVNDVFALSDSDNQLLVYIEGLKHV